MNDGLGRSLVLGEMVWILNLLLECCTDEHSLEEYTVKKMSML